MNNSAAAEAASTNAPRAGALLPAQRATLDAIRVPRDERPVYSLELAEAIRTDLEAALAVLCDDAREVDSRGLWISKRDLNGVFGCEARHLADAESGFEWSVPIARGTLVHKAVELSVHSGLSPVEATNAAIERLVDTDENLGRFLAGCSPGERADLEADCITLLTRFSETFPQMQRSWRPTTEMKARVRLCGGTFVLSGKYDLTLGTPEPVGADDPKRGGSRAGKVIIDLKSGGRTPTDPEDLRFYALIETLSVGVPPLGIGSFYVAEGRIENEFVTPEVLESALRRTVDGISRYIELASGAREPRRSPGPACRWCPISSDCGPGQDWLAELDD